MLFGAVLLLTGCPFGASPKQTAEAVVPLVAQKVRTQPGMLARTDPNYALDRVEVYTDFSLTMQPYAAAGAGAVYGSLLNHLHESFGDKVAYFGFGYVGRNDSAQAASPVGVEAVLSPSSYVRVNNDYGTLFQGFRDIKATRVVVTDGVQSDRSTGSRFGGVVEGAQAHLARGGVFAAYVFRSPYSGTYYPEATSCPGQMRYACAGRPFAVFLFAPSRSALDAFARYIENADLRPVASVQTYGDLKVALAEETVPENAAEGERRRPRPDRIVSNVYEVPVQGFRSITTARVREAALDDDGFLPLQFDLEISEEEAKRLGPSGVRTVFASLRPELQAWAVRGRVGKDLSLDSARTVFLKDQGAAPLLKVTGRRARMVVPVRRPEGLHDGTRQIVWLATFRLAEGEAVRLVPENVSTSVDCNADACERILNLRPLLGAILNRTYSAGQLLFLTDWPSKG